MTTAEIMALIERYRTAGGREEHHTYKEEVERVLEEVCADAKQWRKYKARKDAVIAAGMGRNPLRGEEAPDTYAVINTDGQVEYSAEWPEACHDHIKDMQEVDGSNAGRWKVRGIKILKARAK
jgi:hypothetical protein